MTDEQTRDELRFAPMHFDNLPKSRDGRTTRADMCATIANTMFQNWLNNQRAKHLQAKQDASEFDEAFRTWRKNHDAWPPDEYEIARWGWQHSQSAGRIAELEAQIEELQTRP